MRLIFFKNTLLTNIQKHKYNDVIYYKLKDFFYVTERMHLYNFINDVLRSASRCGNNILN